MSSPSVVLYPSPGMGHLVSMFELGKLLTNHNVNVTILIVEPHYNTGSATASFVATASLSNPTISFHRLPSITPPPNPSPHHEALAFDVLRLSNPNLLSYLSNSPPSALVIDFFCACAFDVTAKLNIPTYIFFTSGVSALSVLLHFPSIHDSTPVSFRQLDSEKVDVPGVPALPGNHMPLPMLDRDDNAYEGFLDASRRAVNAAGIIINAVYSLEKRAADTLNAAGKFPPLYCIGPVINSDNKNKSADCLSWLDEQPRQSVVFLCFGSLGLFSAAQIREIAVGLEKSEQRFLWVVRSPPSDDPNDRFKAVPEPDLDRLLPEGFLNRTKERGLVVKSWAPQAAVLKHEAVGGFVTHCGWNSVLEAVTEGVPMIGWPLYAEQRMNLVFLVEEMRLAVEMKGYDEELVSSEEVERKVRWLMESDEGRELRERTVRAKEAALAAVEEGGESHRALVQVVKEIRGEVMHDGTLM